MLGAIVLWVSIAVLAWVYLGYPLTAALLGRFRPVRLARTTPPLTLTVAIAVYNEAGQIAERIADALAQESSGATILEILVGSDGSTDATESIVARLADSDPRVRLLALPRAGQTAVQNALFEASRGEAVVLTDAETRFAPGCLAALVDAFRDPRVGCATGRLEWRGEWDTATSAQEGLYWRYERQVRDLESRAGLLTAVTGALLAVRRDAYHPVPPTASMDHLLPLFVREAGGLVVYIPFAVATDRPISGLGEQFRNRTRTATRGIRANLTMVGRLAPWRTPGAALAVWSHKLLRWATPWLMLAALVSGFVQATRGDWLAGTVAIGITVIVLAAALGQLLASTGRRPPRPLAFARAFAVVNVAFARAWLDVLRGRQIVAWRGLEWGKRP